MQLRNPKIQEVQNQDASLGVRWGPQMATSRVSAIFLWRPHGTRDNSALWVSSLMIESHLWTLHLWLDYSPRATPHSHITLRPQFPCTISEGHKRSLCSTEYLIFQWVHLKVEKEIWMSRSLEKAGSEVHDANVGATDGPCSRHRLGRLFYVCY